MHLAKGNIHIHSAYSDGTSSIPEIAKQAANVGLDFIIITDHNTLKGLPEEGYHHGALVLCGSEINLHQHHYLALNIKSIIHPNDDNPQQVINDVRNQNGLGFIAHPFEIGSPLALNSIAYPWTNWDVKHFTGIEVWNWSSQWRDGIRNIPKALYYAYLQPTGPIKGPCPQAMSRFDQITRTHKITAIAGSDAHNWPIRRGPIRRDIFPYEYLFRTANNYLLLPAPLSKDPITAKVQILSALAKGQSYIVNNLLGDPKNFLFTATSLEREYQLGDTVPQSDQTALHIQCPHTSHLHLRIIHNGSRLNEISRCNVSIRISNPGTYRLEVWFRKKPWIFTNPIYVL